jgi:hypothetical protein
MQGVRRARATGTEVILRAGVSCDLKIVRRSRAALPARGFVMITKITRALRTQSLRDHGIWACREDAAVIKGGTFLDREVACMGIGTHPSAPSLAQPVS